MTANTNRFSEGLSKPIAALYKLGGLMLVFVFLGALMLLGGNFLSGAHSGAIMTVGTILTFGCLLLYALPQMQAASATRSTRDFCERIAGNWWELVIPIDGTALSWISIEANPVENVVALHGQAFDGNGVPFARWRSVASCVNAGNRKVFYHWEGYQVAAPDKRYHGFGEIDFRMTGDQISTGDGVFFDARLDVQAFTTKSFRIRRSTDPDDAKIIEGGSDQAITAALIQRKIKEF